MSENAETDQKFISPFAEYVFTWMKLNNVSGRELARRTGLSASYFNTLKSGKTGLPNMRTIEALAKVLGEGLYIVAMASGPESQMSDEDLAQLQNARNEYAHPREGGKPQAFMRIPAPPNAAEAIDVPTEVLAADLYLPLDVPVLGVSMGGDGHDFQFNGETVDYVRRPLGIAKAKRAYATFVVGESMLPAFREGAVVFVNPDRPPSIGDDVVIELHPLREGEPGPGYIKRLKKRTPTKIVVEQFNPPDDLEFDLADVKAMHRVVPWNELLGI